MGGDGGQDERPGLARRLSTALAVLMLVALAGAVMRQVSRLDPFSRDGAGPPGGLEIHAGADRETAGPSLPPPIPGVWEVLPRAELAPRSDPLAVWTGQEVFLWGGAAADGESLADGALYDPVARTWSPIPLRPRRAWQEGAVGFWTGEEVLVLGGRRGVGQDPLAQAYDPARGVWRTLPHPPRGWWLWDTAVWTGTHVVIAEESEGGTPGTLRYDPGSDTWEQGGGLSTMTLDASSRAVWLDGEMVVSGQVPGSARLMLQSFDPFGSAWRRGRGAPVESEWYAAMAADPDAGDVLVAGPVPADDSGFLVARWSKRDGWRPLPDVPPALRVRPGRILSTPAGPLLWPEGPVPPSALSGGTWRPLPRPPMDKRSDEAVVWTDAGLFVWGGRDQEAYDSGALFRPASVRSGADQGAESPAPVWTGVWQGLPHLPEAVGDAVLVVDGGMPLVLGREADGGLRRVWRLTPTGWVRVAAAGAEPEACAVPLPGRLLMWARDDRSWTGTLVDLEHHRASALPAPPLPLRGMMACTAWGGRAVLAVTSGEGAAVAAYDPAGGSWEPLPELPPLGLLIGALPAGQDEQAPLLLVTDLTVARLDPGGQWLLTQTPRNGFAATTPAVVWADDRLLVWGGVSHEPVRTGWSWDMARDRWKQIRAAAFGGTVNASPHVWTGDRWVVWGERSETGAQTQDVAAFDPSAGAWLSLPASTRTAPVVAAAWHDGLLVLRADGTVERLVPDGSDRR